jgi:hypothetical protein
MGISITFYASKEDGKTNSAAWFSEATRQTVKIRRRGVPAFE